jgi:predicted nucleic acid-binding protein
LATLVDTSVWIDHFRRGNRQLIELIERGEALIHPLIVGEIACGHLKNREEIIDSLLQLPSAKVITFKEGLSFIEKHRLYGKGIGIIDIQILAACLLSNARLFTLDKKLDRVFQSL